MAITFVDRAPTSLAYSTGASHTASVTTAVNDTLVHCVLSASATTTFGSAPTGGTSLSWTAGPNLSVTNFGDVAIWAAQATTAETFTLTQSNSGSLTGSWTMMTLRFRGASGLGAVSNSTTDGTTGAPSISLTTTVADSTVVTAITDFNGTFVATAGASWITSAGTVTEDGVLGSSGTGNAWLSHILDAGAVGSKTTGLTTPTSGLNWAIIAVEILPVTAGGGAHPTLPNRARFCAASSW